METPLREFNTIRMGRLVFRTALVLGTFPVAGHAADTVVVTWSKQALQAVRDTHPGPPIVARAMAITHTCMYDAWAPYDAVAIATRLHVERRPESERTTANKNEAESYAALRCLTDLFPSEAVMFNTQMTALGYDPANAANDDTPAGVGNRAAAAVLLFRHHDGSNQLGDLHPGPYSDYTGYVPVNTPDVINNPDHWQPLRVPDGQGGSMVQTYVAPQWGNVIPFALNSGHEITPLLPPPPSFYASPRAYRREVRQILDYSEELTDRQKMIAEYWADGPRSELPPGHWCLFAAHISARDNHDVDADTKMFFTLANALFDASIAAWDAKRYYDSVRPVTSVHSLFQGQQIFAWAGPYLGTRWIPAEQWEPYQPATVVTPPFPEYISGHSTFSAAGAEIFRRFTGSDFFGASVVLLAGSSRIEPGATPASDITLRWQTFSAAADQAGLSRRYGGIHFARGDEVGRLVGRIVGEKAWDKAQSYIEGICSDRDAGNKR
jgi:hypothetical protein